MRILVIDDKNEERDRASAAVEAAGHEAVTASDMAEALAAMNQEGGVDGVVTDLFWQPSGRILNQPPAAPPAGLLVMIEAITRGVPVVVCTDGNHHGPEMSWIYDAYVSRRTCAMDRNEQQYARKDAGRFEWMDNTEGGRKLWSYAVQQVLHLIAPNEYKDWYE